MMVHETKNDYDIEEIRQCESFTVRDPTSNKKLQISFFFFIITLVSFVRCNVMKRLYECVQSCKLDKRQ